MVASWVRMKFWPRSKSSCSLRVLLSRPKLQDGHAGGVVLDDVGRGGARRKDAQQRLRDGRDLRQRQFDLGVGLEVDADHRDAVVGLRFDVLDIVDGGGHGALEDGDDALFHLLGREAAVGPDDADDRNIDIGEDIHRHGDDRAAAEDGDQHAMTTKV